jgi:hypothetical protein
MATQDKATVSAELEGLQLEEMRERVAQMRQHRESKVRRVAARDSDIKRALRRQADSQAGCWHKKGGKGVENLSRGTDNYYAVVKHQLAHGPIIVICQRCWKVWEPPPPELNKRGASAEDKAEYKRLYYEYVKAVEFPTDNLMSGTQLFQITDNRDVA